MTHLNPGEPAPWFNAPTPSVERFAFSSVAGRYILLVFPPPDPVGRDAALAEIGRNLGLLGDSTIAGFVVLRDPEAFAKARDRTGLRWFFDPDGQISRLYGALSEDGVEAPMWMAIDPSLRILFTAPIAEAGTMFARLRALPGVEDHAGTVLHAPVMIVPRVFDRDLCNRLIACYQADGGAPSGVMREVGGKTVSVLDGFKRRSDADVQDEALRIEIRGRLKRNLLPEILKSFHFRATRVERYIVARYDADEGGYFRAHRDNTTGGTAHRQFACSINLNAEDFEGGDLRFPEYGSRTYRPPTGGAVVFSCSLLHEATPVTRGTRFAYLPFFFDEAGEALRQKNLHLLEGSPAAIAAEAAQAAAAAAQDALNPG